MKMNEQINALLEARFAKDSLMGLATCVNNIPSVRTVDACYRNGAFYVITYALSGKMQQIKENPCVALSGEWFTAHGVGENLGYVGREENAAIVQWLKEQFAAWIHNGHTNFADENTVLLKIRLTDGVLFSDGRRYEIDFR